MSDQGNLFDPAEGARRRDEAMNRVTLNNQEWVLRAMEAATIAARNNDTITSDDVWRALDLLQIGPPTNKKAMCGVMKGAAASGWIKWTKEYRSSERVACHRRPVRVWASLVRASAVDSTPASR